MKVINDIFMGCSILALAIVAPKAAEKLDFFARASRDVMTELHKPAK